MRGDGSPPTQERKEDLEAIGEIAMELLQSMGISVDWGRAVRDKEEIGALALRFHLRCRAYKKKWMNP